MTSDASTPDRTLTGIAPHGHAMYAYLRRTLMLARTVVIAAATLLVTVPATAQTLSDLPLYSAANVPANLMLALSVEYPTAVVAAYKDANGIPYVYTDSKGVTQTINTCTGGGICYYPAMRYLGYFDNAKCYSYKVTNTSNNDGYFTPVKVATDCTGYWSGNMLNWALMTSLDEFRMALTGGARDTDTATTTVLVRSKLGYQSSTGNFPNRTVGASVNVSVTSVIGDSDAAKYDTVYLQSANQNTSFILSNRSDFRSSAKLNRTYSAKVQVCVSGMLEANCKAYGANYKPEGLIQQNFERIRVGASAYTYKFTDTGDVAKYPNGAVRALLRDNGPTSYNGNGARQTNANAEWSATDGTFFTNPAGTDGTTAGGTAPTDSGVINYLNKFGNTNDYEKYDTIADLYWATLAYLMRVPLDNAYTGSVTSTNSLDTTFPVFKNQATGKVWDTNDPMAYTCQSNAILMIGDSHTHCDSGVPTSTGAIGGSGTCGADNRKTLPVTGGADAGLYTNKLGNLPLLEADTSTNTAASKTMAALQGVSQLATKAEAGAGTDSTYFMAGLAYFAHTQDIRTDLTGKQTVDTYVVDVMEPDTFSGSSGNEIFSLNSAASSHGPNMYWLATKYGGFNDINNDGVPVNQLTWHTNTSTAANKDLRPDNYFIGNRPDLIVAGLSSIFTNVSSNKSLSAAGPSVSPSRVLTNVTASAAPYYSPKAGFPTYNVTYVPGTWTGDVTGYVSSAVAGEDVTPVAGGNQWSAAAQLQLLSSYANSSGTILGYRDIRRIATWDPVKKVAEDFTWTGITAAQQASIGTTEVLSYLRGSRAGEGTKFRVRGTILGDIVNSQAALVQGAMNTSYTEVNNPGYAAFVTRVKNRAPVVYVGANDGMLHAFAADFSSPPTGVSFGGGGSELFAYVPSLMFNGPNNTPQVDGLAALANLKGATTNAFTHKFYVDQTPQVADVDFAWTSTAAKKQGTRGKTPDWRTVLVGGLGKGGKGIYALDITSVPSALSTSASDNSVITSKVLWEFTDADLGYTYSRPLIAKTRRYGWVVLLTSGYNNATGKGYLYVIDVKTGALLDKMVTSDGSTTAQVGLARPSGFVQDVADNTVEQVYAGDLNGVVWRFDVSASGDGAYPAPVKFATLKDANRKAQPITTAPRIELDYSASGLDTRRWVFVGTGKFLDTSDLTDTQTQTMYALRDGSGSAPSTTGLPLARAVLAKNDLTTNLNLQDSDLGWYYDLTNKAPGTGGATERIVADPDSVAGIFAVNWGTLIPTNDPCSLKGGVYSSTFASGQSNLLDSTGKPMTYITTDSAITNLQAVQLPNGNFALLYGQTSATPKTANINSGSSINGVTRTNWREILN